MSGLSGGKHANPGIVALEYACAIEDKISTDGITWSFNVPTSARAPDQSCTGGTKQHLVCLSYSPDATSL